MQDYECMIASLQEQVERQSMLSSMTSSMMPEDFYDEEDETSGAWLLCGLMDTSVARIYKLLVSMLVCINTRNPKYHYN